jgi:hypothetical protein
MGEFAGAFHGQTRTIPGSGQLEGRPAVDYQPTWSEHARGAPGTFTVQLVLDHGAEKYVIRPTADDLDVLKRFLRRSDHVWFDLDRKVLMFGNRSVGE